MHLIKHVIYTSIYYKVNAPGDENYKKHLKQIYISAFTLWPATLSTTELQVALPELVSLVDSEMETDDLNQT